MRVTLETDGYNVPWNEWTGQTIQEFTVAVARQELATAQRAGFDPKPRVIVDRTRYDAPMESVRPFGMIEFAAHVDIKEAAEWVWSEVIRRSPVDTGRYQDSHVVMVNGSPVPDLHNWKPGDRIQIVNIQPYSRKIERGLSLMAPNGVYRLVYAQAKRRFRSLYIDSKWVKMPGVGPAQTMAQVGGRNGGRKKLRATVYPAIQIYERPDS